MVQENYGKKQQITPMWMISLLINQSNMRDLTAAIRMIVRITCSKVKTDEVINSMQQMNQLINNFKVGLAEDVIEKINNTDTENVEQMIRSGTEEEMENQSKNSSFKSYFKTIYLVEKLGIEEVENEFS